MNKEEFLGVLRRELLGLTPEDRNRALDYYAELIDDAVEDGQSERDATASLGDPATLAARIARESESMTPVEPESRGANAIPCREEGGELIFEFTGRVHSLTVELRDYDLHLTSSRDGVCRVRCTRDEYTHVDVAEADGLLWVRQRDAQRPLFRGLLRSWSARLTVELPEPEYQELNAQTHSGDVTVDAALGFQVGRVRTVSGDIRYEGSAAILELETTSGDCKLQNKALHSLRLLTRSGDLDLYGVTSQERIRLETTSGDVDLRSVVTAALEVRATSGDITGCDVLARDHLLIRTVSGDVELSMLDTGETRIHTVSGDVELGVLGEKDYRVSTVSGSLDYPRPLPGAGRFTVDTVSGGVSIEVNR